MDVLDDLDGDTHEHNRIGDTVFVDYNKLLQLWILDYVVECSW